MNSEKETQQQFNQIMLIEGTADQSWWIEILCTYVKICGNLFSKPTPEGEQ